MEDIFGKLNLRMIQMTTDIRKWITLIEDEETGEPGWIYNFEVRDKYIENRHQDEWDELTSRIDMRHHRRALYMVQDAFQKWIRPWMKPAWISDIQVRRSRDSSHIMWKIGTGGEDDPDEY